MLPQQLKCRLATISGRVKQIMKTCRHKWSDWRCALISRQLDKTSDLPAKHILQTTTHAYVCVCACVCQCRNHVFQLNFRRHCALSQFRTIKTGKSFGVLRRSLHAATFTLQFVVVFDYLCLWLHFLNYAHIPICTYVFILLVVVFVVVAAVVPLCLAVYRNKQR